MVRQDVQLFGASVRDNLSLFDPTVSDDAIRRALAELGLLDWVEAMPGGLDAPLGAGGGGLSAGEGRLLAFARLLLRDPGLVILDETASRLDPVAGMNMAAGGGVSPPGPGRRNPTPAHVALHVAADHRRARAVRGARGPADLLPGLARPARSGGKGGLRQDHRRSRGSARSLGVAGALP